MPERKIHLQFADCEFKNVVGSDFPLRVHVMGTKCACGRSGRVSAVGMSEAEVVQLSNFLIGILAEPGVPDGA